MNPQTQYPADHPRAPEPKPEFEQRSRGFWTSKIGLVTIAFLLVAAFFLLSEHRAHALGALPFLLLLACPLLHIFMHRGHGEQGGHGRHIQQNEAELNSQNDSTRGKDA